MFSRMLIKNLSSTLDNGDYNMHFNLLSIVWMGDIFHEIGKKKPVELKIVEVLVPFQSC
jgi:metallophosphoesterase superfamily enzyme